MEADDFFSENFQLDFASEDSEFVKNTEENEKKDELGPILDSTPFRARCYTWPRHLEGQKKLLSNFDFIAKRCTGLSNPYCILAKFPKFDQTSFMALYGNFLRNDFFQL